LALKNLRQKGKCAAGTLLGRENNPAVVEMSQADPVNLFVSPVYAAAAG